MKYEPHGADTTPLRRALESVIDHEQRVSSTGSAAMTPPRDHDSPPDLAEFVRQHGDWRRMPAEQWARYTPEQQEVMRRAGVYSLVTADEWREWDRLNTEWQARRRERLR